MQLTQDQVGQFQRDGFLLAEELIAQDDIETLRQAFDELFSGRYETGIQPDEVNWQSGQSDESLTRQICNGWKANRVIAQTVLRADLAKAIAGLGGWQGVRIIQDNVIWKPPGAKSLGYHRDNAYLAWYTPQQMLSCWIALDNTSAEGGTMEVVRGTHLWPSTGGGQPEGEFHAPDDYRAAMTQHANTLQKNPDIVAVVVPAGGGVFHHGWTWHGSGPNKTTNPRRALVLHGAPSETRFVKTSLGQGNGGVYGRYSRFMDDEMDENYFPVLWTEEGYRTAGIDF